MSFGKRGNSPPEQVSLQSRHQSSVTTNARQLRATKLEGQLDVVLIGAAFVAIAACVVIFF